MNNVIAEPINVCIEADEKYFRYLYVMLVSLLNNSKDDELFIYILHRELRKEHIEEITKLIEGFNQNIIFTEVKKEHIDRFKDYPLSDGYTVDVYLRLLIPELLPVTVDKVLCMDLDIIVLHSIRELYMTDLEGFCLGACDDIGMQWLPEQNRRVQSWGEDIRYFNCGVVLWNLAEIRSQFSFDDYHKTLQELEYEVPFQEQDILNYMLQGKVKYLDWKKFNFQIRAKTWNNIDAKDAAVLHFTAHHPWQIGEKNGLFDLWWKTAKETKYYEELLLEHVKRLETGWEKEYTMRRVYQSLFRIYEKGIHIKDDDAIIVYGAGDMGLLAVQVLDDMGLKDQIEGVIDLYSSKKMIEGFEIKHDFTWCDHNRKYLMLVTPANEKRELTWSLRSKLPANIEVIHIADFFEKF